MAAVAPELIDAHVVEIPIDSENNNSQQSLIAEIPSSSSSSPIAHHPLAEISQSPGHLLLLKLYQREEDSLAHRIGLKESRLDILKRESFSLSSLFFAFHALSLTLTYTSSVSQHDGGQKACKNWWVPCFLSLSTSCVLISAVQLKVWGYWKVMKGLKKDRSDGRAVARLMQELRMKGSSFDLSKEPQQGSKRVKGASFEPPLRLLKENLVVICLLGFTALVVPASKFILCM